MNIQYSLFNPLYITIFAKTDWGIATGKIGLFDRLFDIEIETNNNVDKSYLSFFKKNSFTKTEKGYRYEYQF